jgi:hypothetical protein
MPDSLANRITATLTQMDELYHHLLLVVGPSGTGKTEALRDAAKRAGSKVINVNMELSRRMLELTERQRALRLPDQLRDIISEHEDETLFLDNTEIMFDVVLKQDPLRLLQGLARNRFIVATWSGHASGQDLIYADSEHVEYRRYPIEDLLIVGSPST